MRTGTHLVKLEGYIKLMERSGRVAPTDSPMRRFLKAMLPLRLRGALKCGLTRAVEPYSRIRARKLAVSEAPLRIHLGCGASTKPGWVNMDLFGTKADVWWDITRGLPFGDHEVDAVFHEHVLEHLPLNQALALTRECQRVLKNQGVLRIVVPDSEGYLTSYAEGGTLLDDVRPGRPTALLATAEIFFHHGHRSAYDFDTLALLCRESGFATVERSSYRGGSLQPSPDSEHRRHLSLYVESVKQEHRTTALGVGSQHAA